MHLGNWLCLLATLQCLVFHCVYGDCDLKPRTSSFTPGRMIGNSFEDVSSPGITRGICALLCVKRHGHQNFRCVGTSFICPGQTCQCLLWSDVKDIDFKIPSFSFYLNGQVLGEGLSVPPFREFSLDGGLSVGQVLRISMKLMSGKTTMQFMIPPADISMLMDMRSFNGEVVRNSFLDNNYGLEEVSDLASTIAAGKELDCVIIVATDAFVVYFDSVFAFKFAHRTQDFIKMTMFKIMGEGDAGKINSLLVSV
ncbi:galectin [Elysia marginata]|uniref:Galectin n=1 Tax=Elysia marginata TaxID=1093978 RepID=A0AAV4GXE2_9GAST|nr:galectin [Elysia marginata]